MLSTWLAAPVFGSATLAKKEPKKALSIDKPAPFPSVDVKPYTLMALSQEASAFFDKEGKKVVDEKPNQFVTARLGIKSYREQVDIYAAFGAVKEKGSQVVAQRRSEVGMDFFYVKTFDYYLKQTHLFLLPFQMQDSFYQEQNLDGSVNEIYQIDGTVFVLGLEPGVTANFDGMFVELGGYTRTYFFSREQLISTDQNEYDDYAAKIDFEQHIEASYRPRAFPRALLKMKVAYQSVFRPIYDEREIVKRPSYHYGALRSSYYTLAFAYQISDKISIIDDFYHLHQGFFAQKNYGLKRRYFNTLRVVCQL